jgi:thymidylate synthase (FAD)
MKVDLVDVMGSDLSVVNAARVSFNKESSWETSEVYGLDVDGAYSEDVKRLSSKDVKLIDYLAKHKHRSPFNHAFLSFRVKAPIFVARQLQKHEYLTWNEVSRRYVDEKPEFFYPRTWRNRAKDKKQGSGNEDVDITDIISISGFYTTIAKAYEDMLERGVAPEQARMILPQSMYTEWIWSGSLGAFCKMLNLRLDTHTQEETRSIAIEIAKHMDPYFPVSMKALREYPIL